MFDFDFGSTSIRWPLTVWLTKCNLSSYPLFKSIRWNELVRILDRVGCTWSFGRFGLKHSLFELAAAYRNCKIAIILWLYISTPTTRLLFWNVLPTELNKRKPPYHHKGNQCQNKFWTWFFSFDLCFTQHALWPQDLYKRFFSVFRCCCHLNCHILFRAQRRSPPHFEWNNMFFPFCYSKNSLHHRPTLQDIWFRHAPQL